MLIMLFPTFSVVPSSLTLGEVVTSSFVVLAPRRGVVAPRRGVVPSNLMLGKVVGGSFVVLAPRRHGVVPSSLMLGKVVQAVDCFE